MNLNEWAIRWQVPYAAVEDLQQQFGLVGTDPAPVAGESEAAVQNKIRLEASRAGARIWRNNVGATLTEDGSFIRYGLANDSKQMNQHIKSADLVGLRPVMVRAHHVGQVLGVFLAREVKAADWRYSGTPREVAQLRFLELVASLGGDAAFANAEGTIL